MTDNQQTKYTALNYSNGMLFLQDHDHLLCLITDGLSIENFADGKHSFFDWATIVFNERKFNELYGIETSIHKTIMALSSNAVNLISNSDVIILPHLDAPLFWVFEQVCSNTMTYETLLLLFQNNRVQYEVRLSANALRQLRTAESIEFYSSRTEEEVLAIYQEANEFYSTNRGTRLHRLCSGKVDPQAPMFTLPKHLWRP